MANVNLMVIKKCLENVELLLSVIVVLSFLGLAQIYDAPFEWRSNLLFFTLFIVVLIITANLIRQRLKKFNGTDQTILTPIKDWCPLLAIIISYMNLRGFTGVINPNPIDQWLYELDLAWFGVEPTLWIQHYSHPILTDLMALFYAAYFLMPLLLVLHLYWIRKIILFREMSLGLGFCFYMAFWMYILFPAGPPRFYFDATVWDSLPALESRWGIFRFIHDMSDSNNPNPYYSSFPSLHVGLAIISTFYCFRFKEALKLRSLWMSSYITVAIGIIISTVYLRHHWIPDIFAGALLGITSALIAARVKSLCYRITGNRSNYRAALDHEASHL